MFVLDIIFGVIHQMGREIFLFRPLKGRYVWLAPVIYVVAVMLFAGPLLSKIGVFNYTVGLLCIFLSFFGAVLFLLLEMIVFLRVVLFKGLKNTSFHLSSIFLALFVFLTVLIQLLPALDKPMIHNISTNTQPPPSFVKAIPIRSLLNSNTTDYRFNPENVELQKQAYSGLSPFVSKRSGEDLFREVQRILELLGMEIINSDFDSLRLEAVATSFWFGFKDDVLVQIREYEDGTLAEIRSVSRVGVSDLGANAARIHRILEELKKLDA